MKEIAQGRLDHAEENAQLVLTDAPEDCDRNLPAPPDQPSDHPSTYLHSIPHKRSAEISDPHSQESDPDISDGELIGLDVHTSLCIQEIEPIVAEKVPAEEPTNVGSVDPTPSDREI